MENTDSIIQFATLDNDIVVIRLKGRADFNKAPILKQLCDHLADTKPDTKFILDLEECETMDSSFLGVLASIGVKQTRSGNQKAIVVNANKHTKNLIETLGLKYILDLRQTLPEVDLGKIEFQDKEQEEISKVEQIAIMIEAHKELVELNPESGVKFKDVIEFLTESLEEEKEAK